jgi:hypothetical protein
VIGTYQNNKLVLWDKPGQYTRSYDNCLASQQCNILLQTIVAEQPCPMPDSCFAAHGWKKMFSIGLLYKIFSKSAKSKAMYLATLTFTAQEHCDEKF